MGVTKLWELLRPIKQDYSLDQWPRQRLILAVDLSGWIVQCSQACVHTPQLSKTYLCCRGVFFRALSLLSLGIIPVIVLDGPKAPEWKKRKNRGIQFYRIAQEYKELFMAMGLPTVECEGEAEKKCAELNDTCIVDGCLTNDGDAFVYGAKVVYKGFHTDKKMQIEKYDLDDIKLKMGLNTEDLVAYTLLSGGDMCDGVKGVGKEAFLKLKEEYKRNEVENMISRFQDWKNSRLFMSLEESKQSLSQMKKDTHCTICCHQGNKQFHMKQGCSVCRTLQSCKSATENKESPQCPCKWHIIEARVTPFETELKIRHMALTQNPNFPEAGIISEFQSHENEACDVEMTVSMPDCHRVCQIILEKLQLSNAKVMAHLVPVYIKMYLYRMLDEVNAKPLRILRMSKESGIRCYYIEWEKLSFDEFTSDDEECYTFNVRCELFASKFPEVAKEFEKTLVPAPVKRKGKQKKEKEDSQNQPKITDMFKVKKRKSDGAQAAQMEK